MIRIGYFAGIVGIAFALTTASVANKMTFAGSCCGTKDAAAAEQKEIKCVVCGKVVDKGKGVQVECEGKTVVLCCKNCEATFKKGCKNGKDCCKEHKES
ncbi:MAG: hypothetical protein ACUBOA_03195 [Candidatus Loosdrechtia sp.]|uniref:hypothetical protein n=1 Tax=Candidatus Loosdrechtia sp. TaxID=3101272 RepID=UPI003A6F3B14|nr:MAG: hypothetical protein QY305_05480 [Candidatus Jettenia sp. AMX2]